MGREPAEVTALVQALSAIKAEYNQCSTEFRIITAALDEQAQVEQDGGEPNVAPLVPLVVAMSERAIAIQRNSFQHSAGVDTYLKTAREADSKHKGILKRIVTEAEKNLTPNAQSMCIDSLKMLGDVFIVMAQVKAQRGEESALPLFDESIRYFRDVYTAPECGAPLNRSELLASLTGDVSRIIPAVRHAPGFTRALDALLLEAGAMIARSNARLFLSPSDAVPKQTLDLAVADLVGAMTIFRKIGDIPNAAQCLVVRHLSCCPLWATGLCRDDTVVVCCGVAAGCSVWRPCKRVVGMDPLQRTASSVQQSYTPAWRRMMTRRCAPLSRRTCCSLCRLRRRPHATP